VNYCTERNPQTLLVLAFTSFYTLELCVIDFHDGVNIAKLATILWGGENCYRLTLRKGLIAVLNNPLSADTQMVIVFLN